MLAKLFKSRRQQAPFPDIAPDTPFAAIGDIHGRSDLLQKLLPKTEDLLTICVGDYVDRGPQSAEVLRMLHAHPRLVCLSGNHEEMMLDFINAPTTSGRRWLRYGGQDTLQSFGIPSVSDDSEDTRLQDTRDHLVSEMGPDLVAWLNALPPLWISGNVAAVHAGADPALPMARQLIKTLHWGHPDFATTRRTDGTWVIHGHTIVADAYAVDGRIAIDTGSYATGRLTAVFVENGDAYAETVD